MVCHPMMVSFPRLERLQRGEAFFWSFGQTQTAQDKTSLKLWTKIHQILSHAPLIHPCMRSPPLIKKHFTSNEHNNAEEKLNSTITDLPYDQRSGAHQGYVFWGDEMWAWRTYTIVEEEVFISSWACCDVPLVCIPILYLTL